MTLVTPSFNVSEYELYGRTNPYLTSDQLTAVIETENRVNQQLDWVAQLLGWSGPAYWFNLVSNVSQKRQLLTGSYGVYNSFLYPEVREIRNWENTVVVKADENIQVGQVFYLGDNSYTLQSLSVEGDNYVLSLGELTDQFYSDIAANLQLKVDSPLAKPFPFNRPSPNGSADSSFVVVLSDDPPGTMSLLCESGSNILLPVIYNVLYADSRVFFNLPVQLVVGNEIDPGSPTEINPLYDFVRELWYIDIPASLSEGGAGLSATLAYNGYQTEISILTWSLESDWGNLSTLENFKGVWANKGGKLPFNFVFDSLSLHGFDDTKSLYLAPIERALKFNDLLDLVYYQRASTSPTPPGVTGRNQVWWNSQSGKFSVFRGDCFNCGPWVEIRYPVDADSPYTPDYIFPDVPAFRDYLDPIDAGQVVRILDAEGLSTLDQVSGLTGSVTGPCQVDLCSQGSLPWVMTEAVYPDEPKFRTDAQFLPGNVPIKILNSSGLSDATDKYTIQNLFTTVSEPYATLLMKDASQGGGDWYISPPSELKYIGNTSLFDTAPTDGELYWDYSQPNESARAAAIFYYDRWEYVIDHWELQGDWVAINNYPLVAPPPSTINYGVLDIFCEDNLLTPGDTFQTYDYQISYTVDAGVFNFTYRPITFAGVSSFPQIIISDSLTTAYRYDITDTVFSGIQFNMTPNVMDCATPLRIWKSDALFSVDDYSSITNERFINPLVADDNSGPGDENWERYFVRLPPSYPRNGDQWQKVNLICQDFGLWGSPLSPEDMVCPPQDEQPRIYEEVFLFNQEPSNPIHLYSEPYLYSNIDYRMGPSSEYENAAIIPGFDIPGDGYYEASLTSYDPLHHRQADVSSQAKKRFGDWAGIYVRANPCEAISGFLVNDLESKTVEKIDAPDWDASIYKFPSTCVLDESSSTVDANHYKVGYAFFSADLSAAEDGFFDVQREAVRRAPKRPPTVVVNPISPTITNFFATWRNNVSLTTFSVSIPE